MIITNPLYVSNPNASDKIAGGGLFVHVDELSEDSAAIGTDLDIVNEGDAGNFVVKLELKDALGKTVGSSSSSIILEKDQNKTLKQSFSVKNPHLWHPDDPYLHNLFFTITDKDGTVVDALRHRVGIRKVEFRGKDGFFLNNKPFDGKLIGGNRHQDYAYIGNALPNNTHWRDAQKLRQASMRMVRSAHYPQDPAFMDACDELGIFVIVATPGWHYWDPTPLFGQRVISDIRQMVRRDRNHPSVLLWEPILNETRYPETFAKTAHDTVQQEYPYQGSYTACDDGEEGHEAFDVIYKHPVTREKGGYANYKRCIFTREFGDNVDDWNAQNSSSRVAKAWGEQAQMVQAKHYANPDYPFTCLETLYAMPPQHVGGALWHPFDHQRGYHPDPFWGGIFDAFRQPKISYYMFRSQMDPELTVPHIESGPFLYIANEMTPFSSSDIVIYSNCDEVRVRLFGKDLGTRKTHPEGTSMPHSPVVYTNVLHFMDLKKLHRAKKQKEASIEAEGIINGNVVATAVKFPSVRREKILLKADTCGAPLIADGSDLIPVVAYHSDRNGRIKRLSEEIIRFTVTGEGELIDDGTIEANPVKSRWGEAVALIRAGHKAGKISVKAELIKGGINRANPATIEIQTYPAAHKLIYNEVPEKGSSATLSQADTGDQTKWLKEKLEKAESELNRIKLKEVERQQSEFEGKGL